jgi:hypothetical protein
MKKQFICMMHKFGHRDESIGIYETFKQARAHITEALLYDHEREDHPAKKAPIGIGSRYMVSDGDYSYWIDK